MKKNKAIKIVALLMGSVTVAGIAFAIYARNQVAHLPPMLFDTNLRVFTAQNTLKVYDEQGKVVANRDITFPVTKRPGFADRGASVTFDRNHFELRDSFGRTVFQQALVGAGQVIIDCSYHPPHNSNYSSQISGGTGFQAGEGIKPVAPHTFTVVILPDYHSPFL